MGDGFQNDKNTTNDKQAKNIYEKDSSSESGIMKEICIYDLVLKDKRCNEKLDIKYFENSLNFLIKKGEKYASFLAEKLLKDLSINVYEKFYGKL